MSVGFSESERRQILTPERYVATVAVAASIIASVRLAKVADLDLNISRVVTTVQQSVRLARTILTKPCDKTLILLRQGAGERRSLICLAHDLQNQFSGIDGYSPRNLKYMRSPAEAGPEPEIVPQLVALLPWGHVRVLLDRINERPTQRQGSGTPTHYLRRVQS